MVFAAREAAPTRILAAMFNHYQTPNISDLSAYMASGDEIARTFPNITQISLICIRRPLVTIAKAGSSFRRAPSTSAFLSDLLRFSIDDNKFCLLPTVHLIDSLTLSLPLRQGTIASTLHGS